MRELRKNREKNQESEGNVVDIFKKNKEISKREDFVVLKMFKKTNETLKRRVILNLI